MPHSSRVMVTRSVCCCHAANSTGPGVGDAQARSVVARQNNSTGKMLKHALLPSARRRSLTLHFATEWTIQVPSVLQRLHAFVTENDGNCSILCSAKGSKLARE